MQTRHHFGLEDWMTLDTNQVQVLASEEERTLLGALADCKEKLAVALAKIERKDSPAGGDDPLTIAHSIASFYTEDGPSEARLGAVFRRYSELRSQLALANVRLVAHVAKRFRDRGVAYSDLLQEGFCGLLEAIDRFDLTHGTKLATYATWWIRQSMQRAVASGAYPVRLSPRHLRQLAQNQDRLEPGYADASRPPGGIEPAATTSEMIHRIHTATRPTISLDATVDHDSRCTLIETMTAREGDHAGDADRDEIVGRLLQALRPREQQVLELRFGLGDKSRLSLSQVGAVLKVSKERVRQIQDRALEKLRALSQEHHLGELLTLD